MQRQAINPWNWSVDFGYSQAELLEAPARQLLCSGQTSVNAEGAPQHIGDMRQQMELALDNLETVLAQADMQWQNVVRLVVYTTDVDETMKHFDVLPARLQAAGVVPAMTLVGVTRLAIPGLMFEVEATAAA